ncbi:hypothetical protein IAD21_02348 [Abditibacteriota bacterium]|nr:hypothetical protein IAD21_02348 [Abditibacteriota bacterium]
MGRVEHSVHPFPFHSHREERRNYKNVYIEDSEEGPGIWRDKSLFHSEGYMSSDVGTGYPFAGAAVSARESPIKGA